MTAEKRMLGYLPNYWHEYPEIQEIMKVEGVEVDELSDESTVIYKDGFIMTACLTRVEEWEKWLGLPPTGTLDERRRAILAYFQVFVKCNEDSIKALVAMLYDDARAQVSFSDSTIRIKVVPLPENWQQISFPLIASQLERKKPCHISLHVERYYTTWGEIKDNFTNWGQVRLQLSWQYIVQFIPE